MEQYRELVDEILELSHSLRFAGILDTTQNTLYSKMIDGKTSLLTKYEEENFALDLKHIKQIQKEFDAKLGEVIFSHVIRENIQHLVFRINDIIIYVTADTEVDHNTMVEISKLIRDTIKNKLDKKLSFGTITP